MKSKFTLIFICAALSFAACTKDGAVGPQGPAGTPGTTGATGATGATGGAGPAGSANVIADSVSVPAASWVPATAAASHDFIFLSSKLNLARINQSVIVVEMKQIGNPQIFAVPQVRGNNYFSYYVQEGTIVFTQGVITGTNLPYNLSFKIFIVPLPGVAWAKAHGVNLNSYQDVKRAFKL